MALGSTQNYVVQPGDVLRFRQWSNNALGGLMLWFANSSGAYISNGLTDTDGQGIDLDSQQGQWHYRTVALTGQSPETVGSAIIDAFAINELPAPDGAFDIWLADISILSLDGTVHPIYHDQPGINFNPTPWYAQTTANLRGISEPVPASMATTQNETTYYLDDHLGTAQMEVTGTGWPVWQGQFTPFGSELDTETTSNHYKFTGKERDAESGLDYFGARYYGSSMGRFMSPDPSGLLAQNPADPQSWNLYAYARNNPLINIDPTGLDCVYANDSGDGVESIDHDSNSGECSVNGGTWLRGYADESWVQFNRTAGMFEGASVTDGGSTVDFTQFGAGTKTSYDGLCLDGCSGFGTSSADTNWLTGMLVGNSQANGLDGLLTFMSGRDEALHGDGWNRLVSGPGFSMNAPDNWAGPGGMGVPQGQGDWAAATHDYNFNTNGIKIGSYFNPTLSPQTARALIQSNNTLIQNAGGAQSVKIGMFFGVVNAFQLLTNAWR